MHLWHYERLSELLARLQARFPEPVWRELGQAIAAHARRIAAPRPGRAPPLSESEWAEWDRPFETIAGENVQGTISSPQAVHCAAGSLVDGAIWAGGGVTVDRGVVVQGPIVSREQIDWQGVRAQSLVAPRIRLGRPAFPLDVRGSILCQTLVLGPDASLSGALSGALVVSGRVVRQESGAAVRGLYLAAQATVQALDVPCAVTTGDGVRLGPLCAEGDVLLGEGCRAASIRGQDIVLGANCVVSHVYARGTLALGPGSRVETAVAQGRIAVDATAEVEGGLIASAAGEVEYDGQAWFADRQYHYQADVAALLDLAGPGERTAPAGSLQGWAAVRDLPHALYRQMERLQGGWFPALRSLKVAPQGEAACP